MLVYRFVLICSSLAVPGLHMAAMEASNKRLKALQHEVRKVQRKLSRLAAAAEKAAARTAFHRKVAIAICKTCKGSTTEAQQYLHMQECMCVNGHTWSREDVLEMVGRIGVEPCTHSMSPCADDETSSILEAAHSFLLGSHTFRWVREQNEKKGIAPMMQATLAKYESLKSGVFTEAKVCDMPKTTAGKYKWARRWAKTWKVWKGRLKSGQVLPPEQRRDKVNSSRQPALFYHSFSKPVPAGAGIFRSTKIGRKMVHEIATEIRARHSL